RVIGVTNREDFLERTLSMIFHRHRLNQPGPGSLDHLNTDPPPRLKTMLDQSGFLNRRQVSRRYSFRPLTIRIICTNPKIDPAMTPAIYSQWVCSQWSSSLPISNPTTTAAGMMKAISE